MSARKANLLMEMVAIGINWASLLGFLQIVSAIAYFAVSINQATVAVRSGRDRTTRIIQSVFAPLILLLSGAILFFQGWRLDPLLQFQQYTMSILIVYLVFLDLRRSR